MSSSVVRELRVEDFPSWEAYVRALLERSIAVNQCAHCWHDAVPRLCCWCGASEGPQHGPYAPEGGR